MSSKWQQTLDLHHAHLVFELLHHLHCRKSLLEAGIRLSTFFDSSNKFPIDQLNPVVAHRNIAQVDRLLPSIHQIVIGAMKVPVSPM